MQGQHHIYLTTWWFRPPTPPPTDELAILLRLRPGGGHLIAALPALLRLLRVDERLVGR